MSMHKYRISKERRPVKTKKLIQRKQLSLVPKRIPSNGKRKLWIYYFTMCAGKYSHSLQSGRCLCANLVRWKYLQGIKSEFQAGKDGNFDVIENGGQRWQWQIGLNNHYFIRFQEKYRQQSNFGFDIMRLMMVRWAKTWYGHAELRTTSLHRAMIVFFSFNVPSVLAVNRGAFFAHEAHCAATVQHMHCSKLNTVQSDRRLCDDASSTTACRTINLMELKIKQINRIWLAAGLFEQIVMNR